MGDVSTRSPSPVAASLTSTARSARAGGLAASLGYCLWGLVPLYWKELAGISAVELIAHRLVWSLLFLAILVAGQAGFGEVLDAVRHGASFRRNLLSSVLLTVNWLVYVWGVNAGQVIECSLGYFLVPLMNVAIGRGVLHEHLRRPQWFAIACAAVGVAVMLVQLGRLPWIALTLAGTWGAYGLMRKQSPLGSLNGLAVETLLLTPVAIGFLAWQHHNGDGALGRVDLRTHLFLFSAGIVTATPLLLFAFGARRLRMTTLGVLQYIAPTVQLIIGIWVYHETFGRSRAAGFAFIWAALAIYTADNIWAARRPAA